MQVRVQWAVSVEHFFSIYRGSKTPSLERNLKGSKYLEPPFVICGLLIFCIQICMFWKLDAPSVWQTDEIANSQLWWVLFLVCLSGVCLFWTKALKERTLWSVLTTSITDQKEEYKKIFHQFEVNIHDGRHCRELIAKTGDDCIWQSTALVLNWTNVPAQNFKRWKYLWTMEWLYKKIPENSILIVTALDCKRW